MILLIKVLLLTLPSLLLFVCIYQAVYLSNFVVYANRRQTNYIVKFKVDMITICEFLPKKQLFNNFVKQKDSLKTWFHVLTHFYYFLIDLEFYLEKLIILNILTYIILFSFTLILKKLTSA